MSAPSWSPAINDALQAQAKDAVREAGIYPSTCAVMMAENLIRRDLTMDEVHAGLRHAFRAEVAQ